jgi:hypothetical protein
MCGDGMIYYGKVGTIEINHVKLFEQVVEQVWQFKLRSCTSEQNVVRFGGKQLFSCQQMLDTRCVNAAGIAPGCGRGREAGQPGCDQDPWLSSTVRNHYMFQRSVRMPGVCR